MLDDETRERIDQAKAWGLSTVPGGSALENAVLEQETRHLRPSTLSPPGSSGGEMLLGAAAIGLVAYLWDEIVTATTTGLSLKAGHFVSSALKRRGFSKKSCAVGFALSTGSLLASSFAFLPSVQRDVHAVRACAEDIVQSFQRQEAALLKAHGMCRDIGLEASRRAVLYTGDYRPLDEQSEYAVTTRKTPFYFAAHDIYGVKVKQQVGIIPENTVVHLLGDKLQPYVEVGIPEIQGYTTRPYFYMLLDRRDLQPPLEATINQENTPMLYKPRNGAVHEEGFLDKGRRVFLVQGAAVKGMTPVIPKPYDAAALDARIGYVPRHSLVLSSSP